MLCLPDLFTGHWGDPHGKWGSLERVLELVRDYGRSLHGARALMHLPSERRKVRGPQQALAGSGHGRGDQGARMEGSGLSSVVSLCSWGHWGRQMHW